MFLMINLAIHVVQYVVFTFRLEDAMCLQLVNSNRHLIVYKLLW